MNMPDKEYIFESLLRYNYFPMQKEKREELPPNINSTKFTPDIAKELIKFGYRKGGYDQVEFRLTRFNNIPRLLSIPHPLAYSYLCNSFYENWDNLKHITINGNSLIKPRKYRDGRLVIMDYGNPIKQIEEKISNAFNKKFIVHTDIANFYPSIYTHAIAWALVGFETAKCNTDQNEWFNQIDLYQRLTKRNETNGVPIGPASSNIICEIILSKIDNVLKEEGFEYVRYIDDYTGYFDKYEDAEKFIRRLSEELTKYKLTLSLKKTSIIQTPHPISPDWIIDLSTRLPSKDQFTQTKLIRFLDYAVKQQMKTPDGSILKYATMSIINHLDKSNVIIILKYLLNLCIKYPILIPFINFIFNKYKVELDDSYHNQFIDILNEHAINKRSDAIVWSLFYIQQLGITIPKESAKLVLETNDCLSILYLYLSNQFIDEVVQFCEDLNKCDLYQLDQYWILLYQLFIEDKISNPYDNENAYVNHCRRSRDTIQNARDREIKIFEFLKSKEVCFINKT